MNEAGIRVANRAGPQAQELPWHSVELVAAHRPRWPFTVMRKEQKATLDNESSTVGNNKPPQEGGLLFRQGKEPNNDLGGFQPFKPAALRSIAALSVRSQVNSGSSRPK